MKNEPGKNEPGQPKAPPPSELTQLRASIDNIDAALIYMLAERFRCTDTVGRLKALHQLPPTDLERENQQLTRLHQIALQAGLPPALADRFFRCIVESVVTRHRQFARELPQEKPSQEK
ncbi:chorismate mutase [Oecophyllibacter saccharovorans]|uniref:chorismate mutase n=1 Tax=Oecophyllibacter saccharovorans TaxID=2558360 RepID=A0A506URI3_9PROT|nr:chorismate mutase [Oecophyllibacter saccharovorans]TPW35693.1 chorismate mutase [Oecophyllibacter saccharovorans]